MYNTVIFDFIGTPTCELSKNSGVHKIKKSIPEKNQTDCVLNHVVAKNRFFVVDKFKMAAFQEPAQDEDAAELTFPKEFENAETLLISEVKSTFLYVLAFCIN